MGDLHDGRLSRWPNTRDLLRIHLVSPAMEAAAHRNRMEVPPVHGRVLASARRENSAFPANSALDSVVNDCTLGVTMLATPPVSGVAGPRRLSVPIGLGRDFFGQLWLTPPPPRGSLGAIRESRPRADNPAGPQSASTDQARRHHERSLSRARCPFCSPLESRRGESARCLGWPGRPGRAMPG